LLRQYQRGHDCPTIDQVMAPVPRRSVPPAGKLSDFLKHVRDRMRKTYGIFCCSLSENFYLLQRDESGRVVRESFKVKPPTNDKEALACLPAGKGDKIAGIYIALESSRDDVIMAAYTVRSARSGALMQGSASMLADLGVRNGHLQARVIAKKLERAVHQAVTERLCPLVVKLLEAQEHANAAHERNMDILHELAAQQKEILEEQHRAQTQRRLGLMN
jgi:hypothetical protein